MTFWFAFLRDVLIKVLLVGVIGAIPLVGWHRRDRLVPVAAVGQDQPRAAGHDGEHPRDPRRRSAAAGVAHADRCAIAEGSVARICCCSRHAVVSGSREHRRCSAARDHRTDSPPARSDPAFAHPARAASIGVQGRLRDLRRPRLRLLGGYPRAAAADWVRQRPRHRPTSCRGTAPTCTSSSSRCAIKSLTRHSPGGTGRPTTLGEKPPSPAAYKYAPAAR